MATQRRLIRSSWLKLVREEPKPPPIEGVRLETATHNPCLDVNRENGQNVVLMVHSEASGAVVTMSEEDFAAFVEAVREMAGWSR